MTPDAMQDLAQHNTVSCDQNMHSRILLGTHTRDKKVRHAKAKTLLAHDKEIKGLRGGDLYYHYVGVT